MRLDQRIAYWTALALTYANESANGIGTSESATEPVRPDPDTRHFPNRAMWLQRELDLREWTVHDLQKFGGPSWKTARKILNGQVVQGGVLEKVAQALSQKKQVLLREIPKD
jgi:hypothetical protein